jgi:hypothetical protein
MRQFPQETIRRMKIVRIRMLLGQTADEVDRKLLLRLLAEEMGDAPPPRMAANDDR